MWKTILPIGTRNNKFGKWLPSWEGLYKVVEIIPGNSYFVQSLQGVKLTIDHNGKYLKKYYRSMWQEMPWPVYYLEYRPKKILADMLLEISP